jgi:hypothetical protein
MTMHISKPPPLLATELPRRICPVCGNVAYSIAGMHPQCAMEQADLFRVGRLRTRRKAAAKSPASR